MTTATETHYAIKIITAHSEYFLCRPLTGHVATFADKRIAKKYYQPSDVEGVVRHKIVKVKVTIEDVGK